MTPDPTAAVLTAARRALAERREVRVVTATTITYGSVEAIDGTTLTIRDRGGRCHTIPASDLDRLDVLDDVVPAYRPGVPTGARRCAP